MRSEATVAIDSGPLCVGSWITVPPASSISIGPSSM
jgi:hypothetical protein